MTTVTFTRDARGGNSGVYKVKAASNRRSITNFPTSASPPLTVVVTSTFGFVPYTATTRPCKLSKQRSITCK